MVCLSVILLCYRVTCLWFCNKRGIICAGPLHQCKCAIGWVLTRVNSRVPSTTTMIGRPFSLPHRVWSCPFCKMSHPSHHPLGPKGPSLYRCSFTRFRISFPWNRAACCSYVWVCPLSISPLRFIHAVTHPSSPFAFTYCWTEFFCMDIPSIGIHLPVNENVGSIRF